mmetsp:Transcript_144370/g.255024  ORF Transcript_144370/g.255024 Transcript_144370/m.255024 type:complete len:334 (-) Transcript_144370:161-1162(-)
MEIVVTGPPCATTCVELVAPTSRRDCSPKKSPCLTMPICCGTATLPTPSTTMWRSSLAPPKLITFSSASNFRHLIMPMIALMSFCGNSLNSGTFLSNWFINSRGGLGMSVDVMATVKRRLLSPNLPAMQEVRCEWSPPWPSGFAPRNRSSASSLSASFRSSSSSSDFSLAASSSSVLDQKDNLRLPGSSSFFSSSSPSLSSSLTSPANPAVRGFLNPDFGDESSLGAFEVSPLGEGGLPLTSFFNAVFLGLSFSGFGGIDGRFTITSAMPFSFDGFATFSAVEIHERRSAIMDTGHPHCSSNHTARKALGFSGFAAQSSLKTILSSGSRVWRM